jgi:hypothetical protein
MRVETLDRILKFPGIEPAGFGLTEVQLRRVNLFRENITVTEIARREGVTRGAVNSSLDGALAQIRWELKAIGF